VSTIAGNVTRDSEIDLRRAASVLWSRRWWLVISVAVFTAGCIAAAFLLTPKYRATAVMVAASIDRNGLGSLGSALGQLGGLATLAGVNIGSGDTQTQEALAVLESREFTEAFIRDEQLMPQFYPDRWDSKARRWKGPQEEWPTLPQGFRYFDTRVREVTRDKTTGLITLEIEWHDPVKAAEWANELVTRVNAEMRTRALESAAASVAYLEKELTSTAVVETRRAVSRLLETQINQRMLANVTQEYAFRVVDRALPPDPKDVASPNRLLLFLLGPLLGLIFGALAALTVDALTVPRNRTE
jgi:uncharacterized protein involved in exopolysaccharide biosynthesis